MNNEQNAPREIPGFPGYMAYPDGRIRGKGGRFLKPQKHPGGYAKVALSKRGARVQFLIHRLIASVFLGKSEMCVDHINFNRTDNRIENLRYVTAQENNAHSYGKRNCHMPTYHDGKERAISMRKDSNSGMGSRAIARKYGVARTTARMIIRGIHFKETAPDTCAGIVRVTPWSTVFPNQPQPAKGDAQWPDSDLKAS